MLYDKRFSKKYPSLMSSDNCLTLARALAHYCRLREKALEDVTIPMHSLSRITVGDIIADLVSTRALSPSAKDQKEWDAISEATQAWV